MKSPGKRINLYLVHEETGQRYPVKGRVHIGRLSGEILFPHDPKVSGSHCQIVHTGEGLAIHDTGSSHGTQVDGRRLRPHELYMLQPGAVITVGEQVLRLQAVAVDLRRRRARRGAGGFDWLTPLALLLLLGVGWAAWTRLHPRGEAPRAPAAVEIVSPFEMVERETESTLAALPDLAPAERLRRLNALADRLGAVRGGSEWENRKLELTRELVAAHLAREKKKPAPPAQAPSEDIARIRREIEKLDSQRHPANFDY